MRKLKIRLDDEKVYTFKTLTWKERSVVKKVYLQASNKLEEISERGADSIEDIGAMYDEQEPEIRNMLGILLYSLSKSEPDFKYDNGDVEQEGVLLDKLESLIDIRDIKRVMSFVIIGTLPPDDDIYAVKDNEVLDLTVDVNE